jgi:hypothetical protein
LFESTPTPYRHNIVISSRYAGKLLGLSFVTHYEWLFLWIAYSVHLPVYLSPHLSIFIYFSIFLFLYIFILISVPFPPVQFSIFFYPYYFLLSLSLSIFISFNLLYVIFHSFEPRSTLYSLFLIKFSSPIKHFHLELTDWSISRVWNKKIRR